MDIHFDMRQMIRSCMSCIEYYCIESEFYYSSGKKYLAVFRSNHSFFIPYHYFFSFSTFLFKCPPYYQFRYSKGCWVRYLCRQCVRLLGLGRWPIFRLFRCWCRAPSTSGETSIHTYMHACMHACILSMRVVVHSYSLIIVWHTVRCNITLNVKHLRSS